MLKYFSLSLLEQASFQFEANIPVTHHFMLVIYSFPFVYVPEHKEAYLFHTTLFVKVK